MNLFMNKKKSKRKKVKPEAEKKAAGKSVKIYHGITHISDAVVEEAERPLPKKKPAGRPALWKSGILAAACLCILVTGAALLLRGTGEPGSGDTGDPAGPLVRNTPLPSREPDTAATPSPAPGTDNTSEPTALPEDVTVVTLARMSKRPMLLGTVSNPDVKVTPSVSPYVIEPDLSNITNLDRFYWLMNDGNQAALLAENGFLVDSDNGSHEFFEIYELNRYEQIPNFVTVDSLMHTYHLYFSCLMRNMEKDYLSDSLTRLSGRMLEISTAQYRQLAGSEWEEAARRNTAFFTVGSCLLDNTISVEDFVADTVEQELENIREAAGTFPSAVTGEYEDYTQYIPRGYYAGNETLEKYFQAMMWYGRVHFRQDQESLNRSALLITLALASDPEAYHAWEAIYAVTSFFAGASDDLGVNEYASAVRQAYGDGATTDDLPGNGSAFDDFRAIIAGLPQPAINSLPIERGEDNVIPGFRFLGQRFTIDAAIMQKLIYSSVGKNSAGDLRMLPDVLDVAAALGSDTALAVLEESGATDYQGYSENLAMLREGLSRENTFLWTASLYAGWLNTLRPLLETKGEGYPVFMQNGEWARKNLECFSGSFAELKHDTVLYTKQAVAEMGGGYDENIDDRGYVEPEPQVYARFHNLAELTAQGLKKYGVLTPAEERDLSRLSQIARQLLTISCKELQEETLTDEEYDFIRSYGGNIEHFWYEAAKDSIDTEGIDTSECPAPIVVDIATDPGGQVLEAATGSPSDIYVAVKVDGVLKVARGSVYSFYQFTWPAADRLTDSKWRWLIGTQQDEDGNYNFDNPFERPEWTDSYRYERK